MASTASPALNSRTVRILSAPVALGQDTHGVEEGPDALIGAGLAQQISQLGWNVAEVRAIDSKNLHSNSPEGMLPAHQSGLKIKFPTALGTACGELAELARQSAQADEFVLTLGGDHSIAIGSIGGALLARPKLGVIWVDAHGDFNTPETSPSGHIHGMPLAFLTGLMQKYSLPSFAWLKNFLSQNQLVLVGIRSIDEDERKLMKSWGAHVFTMTEIDRYGIGEVMARAKDILLKSGNRPLHLSYDIDAVDPHFAPSTGTKVRGGLNYREAHFIAEDLASTGHLVGMDLVEINPRLGYLDPSFKSQEQASSTNLTVEIGLELIASALGKRIY